MRDDSDSTPRSPADYLLVVIAFVGFAAGAGGIILTSPFLAVGGATLTLLALLGFIPRRPAGQ